MFIFIPGTSLSMGRDDPEPPGPHDVDHACVTTGRRGFSMPTLLGLRGLKFPASPIGVFAPSIFYSNISSFFIKNAMKRFHFRRISLFVIIFKIYSKNGIFEIDNSYNSDKLSCN